MANEQAQIPQPGESRDFFIDGPAGRLEARLSMPDTAAEPQGVGLICHPHPSYGGTMDNKVAYTLARACNRAGLVALRFNFRGVGRSEGAFDEGRGELDDCLAAGAWLGQALPQARLVLAGFSFGAFVSLRAASRLEPVQLISVAPPMNYFSDGQPPVPECPWFVIQGGADEVVTAKSNLNALRALSPAPEVKVLAGVGHFFHGRLNDLKDAVIATLEARWKALQ